MLAALSLACTAGAGCLLARLKVWAMIPISAIFAVIVVVLGSYLDLTWSGIALILFAVLTLLQVSYLIVAMLSEEPTRRQVHHQVFDRLPMEHELHRTVQMAIADELRVYFASSPEDMPQRLRDKLAMLESR